VKTFTRKLRNSYLVSKIPGALQAVLVGEEQEDQNDETGKRHFSTAPCSTERKRFNFLEVIPPQKIQGRIQ
jgi:hypothetical protein